MPARPPFFRPAAAITVALLAAGVLPTTPAAADDAPVASVTVQVLAVGDTDADAPLGSTPERPAPLGRAPGSADLSVRISNTGTEPLIAVSVANEVRANGLVTGPVCDAGEPADPVVAGTVLAPGGTLLCTASLSGVVEDALHDDLTTVTATGADSGSTVSAQAHFYATAVDESVRLGDRVWLDSDRDGVQDPDEPGIAGVGLRVSGPDGRPVPDLVLPDRVVGPLTTDALGAYSFTHLPALGAGEHYTVAVDPTSTSLEDLVPTRSGVGSTGLDSSTGTATSAAGLTYGEADSTLDFGFVVPQTAPPVVTPPAPTKAPVTLGTDASPEPAIKGATIAVKGSVRRDGKPYRTTTILEFRSDASAAYTKVKSVKSSSKGALSSSLTASSSGTFRYRFDGNDTTQAGVSAGDHVDVVKATVRLTADASPEKVTKGKKITVKGTIRREGKKYKASTVLEFRSDSSDVFTKVKTVRSSSKGSLSAKVAASRSGTFRYRFAGSATTQAGVSNGDHVVVKPKPPSKPKPKTYKNCTALRKVYPHGVGRSGATDETSGAEPVTNFTRDTKTYNRNKKSDRDKDGIACEQH